MVPTNSVSQLSVCSTHDRRDRRAIRAGKASFRPDLTEPDPFYLTAKCCVVQIQEAIRIRTGERGEEAV